MGKIKKNLSHAFIFLRKNYLYLIGGAVLLVILLINTFHESYPDEFDNILGGWYILHGKIIYKDFFTHHGPIAYFISVPALIFSGNSFVKFRLIYSLFLLLMLTLPYLYIRRSVGAAATRFYIALLYIIAIASIYFWGQMLLADNLAGYFLLPVATLLILKSVYNKRLTLLDAGLISLLTTLSVFSSLTYLYLTIVVFVYTFFFYWKSNQIKLKNVVEIAKLIGVLVLPGAVYLLYLVITWSFMDYFYQNFVFNQSYYVYNYPRPEGSLGINPIRYAIVIANKFFFDFTVLLIQVKDFNFNFPLNITLAIANSILIIFLLFKRKFTLAVFVLLFMTFSNVRSSPLTSDETDYQSAVYILFSFMAATLMLTMLWQELKESIETPKKILFGLLCILLAIYSLFTGFYLLRVFSEKAYGKYMGLQPLIYDRPTIAPIINNLTEEGETTWVGPFEFEELLYVEPEIASRYQIFNPGMGASGVIQDQLITDIETSKPKVIWFDKRFHILGRSPEDFGQKFVDYVNDHYITLYGYDNGQGTKYVTNIPLEEKYDLETMLYIRKENIEEIINRLINNSYIKEVPQDESAKTSSGNISDSN